jgi:hypothetical protein
MTAKEISGIISDSITIIPLILSGLVLFKYKNWTNGILFIVCLASFLMACYGFYYRRVGSFIIEFRVIYDLIEHIVFIWFCTSLIAFENWKKITGFVCAILFAGWMHMVLFMSENEIMDTLGTYEMIEMISYVPLAGFAMMKQVELNYKKDNYGEQILLFAIFFYAFSTVVILGLFNTGIGTDHYYIHNISSFLRYSLFAYGFWVIIKRERKKKSLTEIKTKPTEIKAKPTEFTK